MANTTKNKKSIFRYRQEFYEQLSDDERRAIYQGATTLANGFLCFDSAHWYIGASIMGSGAAYGGAGGALALTGRLLLLHAAYPWLIRIATDMAIESGLIALRNLRPDNATDAQWQGCFDKTNRIIASEVRKLWEDPNEEMSELSDENENWGEDTDIDKAVSNQQNKEKDKESK